MPVVKQILLRVPDDVHQRLAERAADTGRSVNSLATTILDAAIGSETRDRRSRLKARAAALNLLRPAGQSPTQTPGDREAAIASTRGLGPVLDAIIDADRDRV
jgi:plasmid stability protein